MQPHVKHQLWILAAALAVMFTRLGAAQLWDEDEPKNAACAREMLERGDWIVPTFNYQLRSDKPILLYWLMMPAYAVFGVNEFSARFWSAALAVGTSLCTYHLGRKLFRAEVGLWAGLMLATSLMFVVAGRAATPDSALVFLSTLSMLVFVGVGRSGFITYDALRSSGPLSDWLPRSWFGFAGLYAVMGLAVLAKGPVGIVLPTAIIGTFLLWAGSAARSESSSDWSRSLLRFSKRFLATTWAMRPITWLLIPLLVAGPWYLLVGLRTDGAWLEGFFGKHNLQRLNQPLEGHSGSVFYYIPAVLIGFFPWSVFLPLSVWELARKLRNRECGDAGARAACVFLTSWCCCWLAVFSFAGTKLPSYVLPIYPALALITARWLDDWSVERVTFSRWWMRVALGSIAAVGIGLLIGLPLATRDSLPGEAQLGLIGLVLCGGAAAAFWQAELHPSKRVVTIVSCTAVLFCITLFSWAAVRVSKHQNTLALTQAAGARSGGNPSWATFRYSPPSLVYYANNKVARCKSPEDAIRFLAESSNPFLIVEAQHFTLIQDAIPPNIVVLQRRPRFLHDDTEVLLLGRGGNLANTDVALRR